MDRYINRLFHVCITVADIEAALEFYCNVLGLESIGKLRGERAPGEILGFPGQIIEIHADHLVGKEKENATVIDLIEFVEPKTVVSTTPSAPLNHAGINRMAFGVDNTDAIYEKLKARGDIVFLCEPQTVIAPTGGKFKILTFKDPFDNVLEVIEYCK
ncbi:putative dioxygenase of extradiol dioxygenase family [Pseudomonas sp. GM21]|jgi:catechol 2,3-dioxygenase-like lactoylglutathione lyase family enzyme|uniref:VOC family protein n=1 Tax=Pseudomonas sp. GM21 TaxID=1144325 RepID=UPI00027253ED|nr:VOC family protein [Pseudomonas sp. GM21]EJM15537.1 putative dioxygenase of extradiol dioxygenase family [Pseudomonas sp. GM21]